MKSTANTATASTKRIPIPPEIIDLILRKVGRADLAYSLGRLAVMKHFLPGNYRFFRADCSDFVKFNFVDENGELIEYDRYPVVASVNLIDWASGTGRLKYLQFLTEKTDQLGLLLQWMLLRTTDILPS